MLDASITPAAPVKSPGSNTGQKVGEGGGALIDYLTVVIPRSKIEERGLSDLSHLLGSIFGTSRTLMATGLREKSWQFYRLSSVIVDRDGELCGRMGMDGNGDTVCISLSGTGTKWVRNWHTAQRQLEALNGRISRCDIAYDDYDGKLLDVHAIRARALAGDFATGGRPPATRFLSDEGYGTGCTLYVGAKGHKELCVYEKGKEQGMKESPWVRAEVRMYGKHVVLPLDILTRPLDYLRGSYSVLAEIITGACERLKTIKRTVSACAVAWVTNARRQMGRSLSLFRETFGDSWTEAAEHLLLREGRPARFAGKCPADQLPNILRSELCPS